MAEQPMEHESDPCGSTFADDHLLTSIKSIHEVSEEVSDIVSRR